MRLQLGLGSPRALSFSRHRDPDGRRDANCYPVAAPRPPHPAVWSPPLSTEDRSHQGAHSLGASWIPSGGGRKPHASQTAHPDNRSHRRPLPAQHNPLIFPYLPELSRQPCPAVSTAVHKNKAPHRAETPWGVRVTLVLSSIADGYRLDAFEGSKGFADRRLTTWLCRRECRVYNELGGEFNRGFGWNGRVDRHLPAESLRNPSSVGSPDLRTTCRDGIHCPIENGVW